MSLRLARAFDEAESDDGSLTRLLTPVAKYWVFKRTPPVVAEALECLGGNGYVEESVMPRLYREAPLNGIWEGAGNMVCLDVFRAIRHEPESLTVFFSELREARTADRRLDAFAAKLEQDLTDSVHREVQSRRLVEKMALAIQAALLVRHSPPAVAEAFCVSRLAGDWGRAFGTLPNGVALDDIVKRARIET